MGLLEELADSARNHDEVISNIIMSPYWTLVTSGAPGMASTLGYQPSCGAVLKETILSSRTPTIVDLAFSDDLAEASVGVATINSILSRYVEPGKARRGMMPRARGKKVAVVGKFPFIERLEDLADEVWTISSAVGPGRYPEEEAANILHVADISIIAGCALVNHSLERYLKWAEPSYTIVFGPSTPLSPLLFKYGADQIGGVKVMNEARVATAIAAGAEDISDCTGLAPIVLEAQPPSLRGA
jgi:uncharacterized protein (DUF4213/DUF364 family)